MSEDLLNDQIFIADPVQLVIDFGNSRTKTAIFNKREIVELTIVENISIEQLAGLKQRFDIRNCIVSSVTDIPTKITNYLEQNFSFIELNHTTPIPVKNLYKTPETLGKDRLAAVVGAFYRFPKTNCLVVDAGTCITVDFIDSRGNYRGGSISPGINLRFKALHTFTKRLPLIHIKNFDGFTGQTTEESILAGVLSGTISELRCTIQNYRDLYPALQVVVTGGDTIFFETKLKSNIFAAPNLVLEGLNEIMNFNAVK